MPTKLDGDYARLKEKIIKEFASIINTNSLENVSDTPDFILAEYLFNCLEQAQWLVNRRHQWYGRKEEIPE